MDRFGSRWPVLLVLAVALLSTAGSVLGDVPNLEGTWAMIQVYPRIAVLPLVGESSQVSYVIQLVDVEQDNELLTMNDTYCFTSIVDSSLLATTEIPDTFIAGLRPQPREATLRVRGETITFVQEPYVEVRGATLDDMLEDALPVDPDDPRVIDQDGDGFPGMTVNVNLMGLIEAQIYVVQRVQYQLFGILSSDRIEGTIEWADEQVVLAATNPMLMADSTGYPDPDLSKHIFIMIRAQEAWTCEWLREHWREIFGIE